MTGEGGHSNFAPGDELEADILQRLSAQFDHVSIERILSGPGLLNIYHAMGEIQHRPAPLTDPAAVTQAALAGDPFARSVLDRFCAILGSVAGDLALSFGARKGVYISGGIAPGILAVSRPPATSASASRSKDRMSSDFLKPIPTRVVLEPHAALIGAASLLKGLNP